MGAIWETLKELLQYQIPLGDKSVGALNMLGAAAVLLSAYLLSRLAQRAIRGGLRRIEEHRRFLILRTTRWSILGLGALTAFNVLGLNLTNLLVVLGGLGLGVGLGLQNAASNLIASVILILERPFKIGDLVEAELPSGNVFGRVSHIGLQSTVIASMDAKELIVPNSKLLSETIHNLTHADRYFRVQIQVGVAYGSDVQLARRTLLEAAAAHPSVVQEKPADSTNESVAPPLARFTQFGESALQFELLAWIADSFERFDIESDLHFSILERFRARGIEMPFPQRVVHLPSTYGAAQTVQEAASAEYGSENGVSYDRELFEMLRVKRNEIANEEGIHAYMVCQNRSLEEMAAYLPRTREQLLEIWGMGPTRVERYGYAFLTGILPSQTARRLRTATTSYETWSCMTADM